jgi:hypothetical protein
VLVRKLLVDWLAALSQDEVVALALELGRPSFEIAGARLGAVGWVRSWNFAMEGRQRCR